jgi:antitoxin CcdA
MPAAQRSKKVPTNVSIRADLVKRAKQLGINLSGVAESAIENAIAEAERKAWLDENAEAIAEYNALVEKRGVFSDDWRTF